MSKVGGRLLSAVNCHPRDTQITFNEERHEYKIEGKGKKPISVTTLIHKYFPSFDADKVIENMKKGKKWDTSPYNGMSDNEIKEKWKKNGEEASSAGTEMHKSIEDYINGQLDKLPEIKEFKMFYNFWTQLLAVNPCLKPYRTEWIVYDSEVMVSGSIDLTMVDESTGDLHLFDWKRSKEIKFNNKYEKGYGPFKNFDNCNYYHYSLQLNFYKHILQNQYKRKVSSMTLVVLHPNQEDFMCIPVPNIEIGGIWSNITSVDH